MGKEHRAVPVHDATGKTFTDLHAAAWRQFGGLIFVMFPPALVKSVAGWLADNDDVDDGDFVLCSSEEGATMYFRHTDAARRLCE